MMIESVQFRNFKILKDTVLPLGRFTLVVGANGSGKSTAIEGIRMLSMPSQSFGDTLYSAGTSDPASISIQLTDGLTVTGTLPHKNKIPSLKRMQALVYDVVGTSSSGRTGEEARHCLYSIRAYSLDPTVIATPVALESNVELGEHGEKLAAVLTDLRDSSPERFELLNQEFSRWIPEFDQIQFQTVGKGLRSIFFRTRDGGHKIPAYDVSHGTLLALCMLALAYLPDPPRLICFEEPERGIHPRLLRDVKEAMYRLSYPESFNEARDPVQVLATTHSPYLLDLFKDHPEEIVIAEKVGNEAQFKNLTDLPHIDDILGGAPLGEIWYTGILGGVPQQQ